MLPASPKRSEIGKEKADLTFIPIESLVFGAKASPSLGKIASRCNFLEGLSILSIESIHRLMKTQSFVKLLFLWFCSFALSGCLAATDETVDKVETVKLYVAATTGLYQPWGADEPQACMLAREENEKAYHTFGFSEIEGFTHEKGYAYELWVEKTTLAMPPADGGDTRYKLIEICKKVAE